ncbi:HNH endonuclease [Ornithinimicrobium faecis]|uniref:HNH endonuclease n=1 Tax=Ornithinimicrobium faecis TaxID=2934158 RepID=A0ABY4YYE0_9MICO|nr:HNH endonuclease signature motif containing protein [Ornithinimicrobium sp. HY1793]USQ81766.1 HNH endonuclease [Ornithinimicrobium sp. HY1793]
MKQADATVVVGDEVLGQDGRASLPGGVPVSDAELAVLFAQEREATVSTRTAGGPADDDMDSFEWWSLQAELDQALVEQGSVSAAEVLSDGLATACSAVGRVGGLGPSELVSVFDPGVIDALEVVGQVRAKLDGAGVALAVEASTRGLHTAVGLSLVDWLRVRCPWLSVSEAGQIRTIVRAGERHWGKALLARVAAGELAVHRGAKVAKTITRLASSLGPAEQAEYADIATNAAADEEISDRDLEVVCQELLQRLLDEKPKEERERTAQSLRCVSRRPLGNGLTRFTVDAPQGDAALLEGVLNGPLAAPEPIEDGAEMDMRSPGQRKFDALVMVINRGLSNPGAPPSSGRASVMITVKADPATGKPVGAGVTALGQVLDAQQVGRFACIGDVTPIALGEYGEPLNLGRTVRLATPGQFKSLLVRDQKCTYPGCSIPGTWCDSHHLVWWCRDGNTDIAVLVLLCPRHHTLVHQKDLMATVSGSVVTWHV